jgi:hypothetical protein
VVTRIDRDPIKIIDAQFRASRADERHVSAHSSLPDHGTVRVDFAALLDEAAVRRLREFYGEPA